MNRFPCEGEFGGERDIFSQKGKKLEVKSKSERMERILKFQSKISERRLSSQSKTAKLSFMNSKSDKKFKGRLTCR